MSSVVVIGGGLAGLSAGCALADRGHRVTILESRNRLGGRASSFEDRETGEAIDNCQHVAMGCCTNYLHFCQTLGVDHLLERQRELHFVDATGAISRFRPSTWLPSPLHLARPLAALKYLSFDDKRQIASALSRLVTLSSPTRQHRVSQKFQDEFQVTDEDLQSTREARQDQLTFREFLESCQQSEHVIRTFWHVVLVSALSESLENISFQQGAQVFVDGFLRNTSGWQVHVPIAPLEEFYGEPLTQWLSQRGGTIQIESGVTRLVMNESGLVKSVQLRDGSSLASDHFILAVPWHRTLDLLPSELQLKYQSLVEIPAAPISSVHLWLDREITSLPHAVFVDHLSQWMFNRSKLDDRYRDNPRFYYQVVISASQNLKAMSQEEIVQQVMNDLQSAFPLANEAKLLNSRVVTEHKAVFSPQPGVRECRPSQSTPVDNLHLAGDWTETGWPATMEGAVRSGYLAAESVLEQLGTPQAVLQPDLPTGRLARWLYKLD
ncbi:MAG: hydroxysqualene dehydroxylase HpnE [Planctomycetaceae bacterium]|jgi:squalene-associated FAD-dependent desaturase|nr:hydroxysqualene dehydroxylase HpnE [Planctomycetaceae bacterium]